MKRGGASEYNHIAEDTFTWCDLYPIDLGFSLVETEAASYERPCHDRDSERESNGF